MEIVSYFVDCKAAWSFMRQCESDGVKAGYPFATEIEGIGPGYGVRWIEAN